MCDAELERVKAAYSAYAKVVRVMKGLIEAQAPLADMGVAQEEKNAKPAAETEDKADA